ncbi:MAG TPA: hypothetical protein VK590_05025 [Saprospiraceae bacterium]|nr:hypothetical protein [Saprospiraceae bacterium]
MVHSKKYTLKIIDFTKGFVVAFITGGLTALTEVLSAGSLPTGGLKSYLIAGLLAGIAYVMKNWLTNSEGKIAAEPKKDIV